MATTETSGLFPITEIMEANPRFTRRQMLGISGMAGLTVLTGSASNAFPQAQQRRPRIACLVTYWAATRSHADWMVTKLLDGYWWHGAHHPSGVEVVSVFIDQLEDSGLGQKVCKSKNIPIFKTVAEAVTLGGKELAVDGVVIVGEHGNYPNNIKRQKLYPRWWIYQQVIQVFERSKRSVPVFNDKHLSYSWDEAKWMFDKSRELNFPLSGGSSIPVYYRTPEIDIAPGTPIKASVVVGEAGGEGSLFHCVDLLQSFAELRRGGETGVRSVQSIRGPEVWNWTERNPWAGKLLESVRISYGLQPGYFQNSRQPVVCIVEYNDGTKGAVYSGGQEFVFKWTYAGEIEGRQDPVVVSMLGMPGPFDQYHGSNELPHWISEMMTTKKEPFNAERLLLSTGITSYNNESNWENGRYSDVGRRLETPFLNISYRPTRGEQFNRGQRPPARPYIRGFDS